MTISDLLIPVDPVESPVIPATEEAIEASCDIADEATIDEVAEEASAAEQMRMYCEYLQRDRQ